VGNLTAVGVARQSRSQARSDRDPGVPRKESERVSTEATHLLEVSTRGEGKCPTIGTVSRGGEKGHGSIGRSNR
jgi:hypothetical protein